MFSEGQTTNHWEWSYDGLLTKTVTGQNCHIIWMIYQCSDPDLVWGTMTDCYQLLRQHLQTWRLVNISLSLETIKPMFVNSRCVLGKDIIGVLLGLGQGIKYIFNDSRKQTCQTYFDTKICNVLLDSVMRGLPIITWWHSVTRVTCHIINISAVAITTLWLTLSYWRKFLH